ncbi:hypothetical protein D9M68_747140 [compost metagenome]
MSFNLATHSADHRQAIEAEKSRLFEFWQQSLEKAKIDAGRMWAEKGKRKGQWESWSAGEIDKLSPPEHRSLVRRELARLG